MNFPDELIRFLHKAERVAALTGAGVSKESGLRTFRDAQTSLWSEYKPTELASPEAYERDPKLVWDWYAMRREKVDGVEPNPSHFALVDMAHHIPDFSLITQNVDNLHRKAGSPNVIELHGNLGRVKCSSCGQQAETRAKSSIAPPKRALIPPQARNGITRFHLLGFADYDAHGRDSSRVVRLRRS